LDKEVEAIIFDVLAHPARRDILRLVAYGDDGASYTEVLSELGLSTGKLNYHIKQLNGFIEKNEHLRYTLTPLGMASMDLMLSLKEKPINDFGKYLKVRKPVSLMPAMRWMAYILMFSLTIPIFFAGVQLYESLLEGGPIEVVLFLFASLAIGIAVFAWVVYMVKNAPELLKHLEKRFYG
jgi:DNA-binding transcriptional ArsR family regulator